MRRFAIKLLVVATASAAAVMAVTPFASTVAAQPPSTERPTDAEHGCIDAPVRALAASGVEGSGGLCIGHRGAHVALEVRGLTPGDVYTAWLGYFDRPSTCIQAPCGMVDFKGDDPAGVLVRIGGGVAGDDGELHVRGNLADIRLSASAQVTLLLLSHGPENVTDHRARVRQLFTPQTPDLGAPLAGATVDGGRGWPHAQAVFFLR